MRRPTLRLAACLLLLGLAGCAGTDGFDLSIFERRLPLDEATVTAGLKEALQVGAERAVLDVSRVDGFLADELLRVALPAELESTAATLRRYGLGSVVDDLEIGMNRAAELAAGEARDVLWTAVTGLTVADAFAILDGGDTAATDYFRARTADELTRRFGPIVHGKMEEVGVARLYGDLRTALDSVPFAGAPALVDLDDHVTGAALDGLFTALGREELKIRRDPVARTTELLRRVFAER